MARMYSRKHGKSGSKKPAKKVNPSWTRYKGKEVELLSESFTRKESQHHRLDYY